MGDAIIAIFIGTTTIAIPISKRSPRTMGLPLATAALLVLIPAPARADAGTPLIIGGMFHLFFGNFFIGILEGYVLAKLFALDRAKTSTRLVLANYASAWVGLLILVAIPPPLDITNVKPRLVLLVALSYLLTLLVEWPFVAWCFRGAQGWRLKSIKASFLIQTVSYAGLFAFFFWVSPITLLTSAHVAQPEQMPLPQDVVMYYISESDGAIRARPITGRDEIVRPGGRAAFEKLSFRPTPGDPARYDLIVHPSKAVIVAGIPAERIPIWPPDAGRHTMWGESEHAGEFGEAPRLRPSEPSNWEFSTDFWAEAGLHASRKDTGEQLWIALATPFARWMVLNTIHLPGDIALFGLGRDQICVFDPATRRIALLARGHSPVAVIGDTGGK